jgi:uncharacterized RDD family membrane protein YckC
VTDDTIEPFLNHAHYAGFWVRFFAACVDMAFYAPFYYAICYAFGDDNRWWAEGVFFIFGLVTYSMFFAGRWQASPGMRLLRFHVCDTKGRRLSFLHAVTWGVAGSAGWIICCAGVFYLQTRFDIFAVNDLLNSCVAENVDMEDCHREIESLINIPYGSFTQLCNAALFLTAFLLFIWVLSIALPKDKTGFHNVICHTRFIKGRV